MFGELVFRFFMVFANDRVEGVSGWEGGDAHYGPVARFLYCEVDRKKICVEIKEVGERQVLDDWAKGKEL